MLHEHPEVKDLSELLKSYDEYRRDHKDKEVNVINLCGFRGADGKSFPVSYKLPYEKSLILFDKLNDLRKQDIRYHVMESQYTSEIQTSGIMIDYDLHVSDPDAKFEQVHYKRISQEIVKQLRNDLIFPEHAANPEGETKIHVFIIVKPAKIRLDCGKFKYGIHVLIPGVRTHKRYKKYLLTKLAANTAINRILDHLGNTYPKPVDTNSASVRNHLFGSCKISNMDEIKPYILASVSEITTDVAHRAGEYLDEPSIEYQSLRLDEVEAEYNLIAEMSIIFNAYYQNKPPLVETYECLPSPTIEGELSDIDKIDSGKISPEELQDIENSLSILTIHDPDATLYMELLNLLDSSYHQERNKWRDVLYAIAKPELKNLAIWFSQKSPEKWDRMEFDRIWEDAIEKRIYDAPNSETGALITERSLHYWAKECNPEKYEELINFKCPKTILMERARSGRLGQYTIAKVLHIMFGRKYMTDCEPGGKDEWYNFILPNESQTSGQLLKWRNEGKIPYGLYTYISEVLPKILDDVSNTFKKIRDDYAGTEEVAKYFERLRKKVEAKSEQLESSNFKQGIIKEASIIFKRHGFYSQLDTAADIIGVKNGVLKLGQECELISGHHEHFISKFTPIMYKKFDENDPHIRDLFRIIAEIIPERDFRNWLLLYLASSLSGGLKEGVMLLWYGGGANGKTFIMRMVAAALGEYSKKINISLFTTEREGADKPNSAVMQLKNCRYCYCEETNKTEKLNTQRLKEIVNPGYISARDLNKKQENFKIVANMVVGHNHKLLIEDNDYGTWRRLRLYNSKVKFMRDPSPGNPFEKKDNPALVNTYPDDEDYKTAMFSILVHYYEILQRDYGGKVKDIPCPVLEQETREYENSQNTISRFISERITIVVDEEAYITKDDLRMDYERWYDTNITKKKHVASEIIQDFENSQLSKYITRTVGGSFIVKNCILAPPTSSLAGEGSSPSEVIIDKEEEWWLM